MVGYLKRPLRRAERTKTDRAIRKAEGVATEHINAAGSTNIVVENSSYKPVRADDRAN